MPFPYGANSLIEQQVLGASKVSPPGTKGGELIRLLRGVLAHLVIQRIYVWTHPGHDVLCERRLFVEGRSTTISELLELAQEALDLAKAGHYNDFDLVTLDSSTHGFRGRKRFDIVDLTTREAYEIKSATSGEIAKGSKYITERIDAFNKLAGKVSKGTKLVSGKLSSRYVQPIRPGRWPPSRIRLPTGLKSWIDVWLERPGLIVYRFSGKEEDYTVQEVRDAIVAQKVMLVLSVVVVVAAIIVLTAPVSVPAAAAGVTAEAAGTAGATVLAFPGGAAATAGGLSLLEGGGPAIAAGLGGVILLAPQEVEAGIIAAGEQAHEAIRQSVPGQEAGKNDISPDEPSGTLESPWPDGGLRFGAGRSGLVSAASESPGAGLPFEGTPSGGTPLGEEEMQKRWVQRLATEVALLQWGPGDDDWSYQAKVKILTEWFSTLVSALGGIDRLLPFFGHPNVRYSDEVQDAGTVLSIAHYIVESGTPQIFLPMFDWLIHTPYEELIEMLPVGSDQEGEV